MMNFLFYREKPLGEGENAGYQHFPFFPTMFSKGFFLGADRNCDCVEKG